MTPVERLLRQRIRDDGPVSVADYMAIALGQPEHGYYRRRDPLGASGDFVTAPEISQMFGELIGLWAAVTWQQMGRPTHLNLVELGPGRGTLMADALRAARQVPAFLDAIDLHLIETSRVLRDVQARALESARPQWHDGVDTVPGGPVIVIANEFFDALPIEQYARTESGWQTRRIGLDGDTEKFCFVTAEDAPSDRVDRSPRAAPGDIWEVSPASLTIVRSLASRIVRDGGGALIIDYGHVASAPGETLQAVAEHRYHDVLVKPGDADLTAHVDFAALIDAARDTGAACHGPIPQSAFLTRLGIDARAQKLTAGAAPDRAEEIRRGHRRLVAPEGMGSLFKAAALTSPSLPVPAGFEQEME